MKANELMIGDWVEYRFTGWTEKGGVYKDYQYVQISTTGKLYVKADNDRVASADGEEFFPIPITPDILEENGFEIVSARDDNAGTMEKYFYPRIGYVYRFSNGEWEVDLIGYGRGFSGAAKYRGVISYVHELQHALRLCGIEKEIVL